ncbi:MAG: hypothetical protein A3J70_07035 [Elusimicrobia bacterium RIFCSPHIGHO2_02_FULL_61_10]|nr:MAG: hypothetical protein A3J70_07035 [Elusimicrobia bacterium RIFCSPHIGHO2_02_FULL_61_10]
MTETCNFDKDDNEHRKGDKLIVRIPAGKSVAADTPGSAPVKHGAYLWDLSPRPRSGKSWRDLSSIN